MSALSLFKHTSLSWCGQKWNLCSAVMPHSTSCSMLRAVWLRGEVSLCASSMDIKCYCWDQLQPVGWQFSFSNFMLTGFMWTYLIQIMITKTKLDMFCINQRSKLQFLSYGVWRKCCVITFQTHIPWPCVFLNADWSLTCSSRFSWTSGCKSQMHTHARLLSYFTSSWLLAYCSLFPNLTDKDVRSYDFLLCNMKECSEANTPWILFNEWSRISSSHLYLTDKVDEISEKSRWRAKSWHAE